MTSNQHDQLKAVSIVYTNYKGETSLRRILPIVMKFGSNQWHPDEQWLLEAMDLEKNQVRAFAMKDIRTWFKGDQQS